MPQLEGAVMGQLDLSSLSQQQDSVKTISLLNFNERKKKPPFLTSPRSLEACRRQGIDPQELLCLPPEAFVQKGETRVASSVLQQRWEHNENRRKEKMRMLLDERDKVMSEERDGTWMASKSVKHAWNTSNGDSISMMERERRHLEKLQLRQKQEIQQMLEYEIRMAQIREVNEQKVEGQRQREEERRKEIEAKRREEDQRKHEKEQERLRRQQEEEERRRTLQSKSFEEDQRRKQIEMEREKERRREARQREIERAQKQEEARRATDSILQTQAMAAKEKERQLQEKEKIRTEQMEEARRRRLAEAAQIRQKTEERVQAALEAQKELEREAQRRFEEKQRQSEEKKRQFDAARAQEREEARRKAEEKAQELARIQKLAEDIEAKKRFDTLEKERLAEERKSQKQKELDRQARMKQMADEEKERQRLAVKEKNDAMERMRVEQFEEKKRQQESMMQAAERVKEKELQARREAALLLKKERQEAVDRLQRVKEFERDKVLDRLQQADERAKAVAKQRYDMVQERQKIRQDADRRKQQVLDVFAKMKKTGRLEMPKGLDLDIDLEDLKRSVATKFDRGSRSGSLDGRQTSFSAHSSQQLTGRGEGGSSQYTPRATSAPPRRPQNSMPVPPPTSSHPAKGYASNSAVNRPSTAAQGVVTEEEEVVSGPSRVMAKDVEVSKSNSVPHPPSAIPKRAPAMRKNKQTKQPSQRSQVTAEEAQTRIDAMRRQQNIELLEILKDEQRKETDREHILAKVDNPLERRRLEKIFGVERAEASDKIMQITETHEKELHRKMVQYRMLP
eukprot:GILK01004719.1.p1 GENE.GILK01004719.1~~GILK01004719.1.p1  ORF type:complete len:797 (-),score=226.44 GILK01004719.1:158-2548(-)